MNRKFYLTVLTIMAGLMSMTAAQEVNNQQVNKTFQDARFRVFAAAGKLPLAEAVIFNPSGQEVARTGHDGMAAVRLPLSLTDVYVVKAPGYYPVEMALRETPQPVMEYEILMYAEKPNVNQANQQAGNTEYVKMYIKQDPETYQKAGNETGLSLEFAVQLSASSRPITDKSSLKSWEELGPLYIHNENGMYKVRIGPFSTQDQAKDVLLEAKARGKKDAFIVIQKGLDGYQPTGLPVPQTMEFEEQPLQPSPSITPEKPNEIQAAPQQPVLETPAYTHIEYKVRLASYLKPGSLNTSAIDQYGTLESYRKGEWTILMIGGLKSEQEALKVKNEVVAKGFKDARVVKEIDGIIQLED